MPKSNLFKMDLYHRIYLLLSANLRLTFLTT